MELSARRVLEPRWRSTSRFHTVRSKTLKAKIQNLVIGSPPRAESSPKGVVAYIRCPFDVYDRRTQRDKHFLSRTPVSNEVVGRRVGAYFVLTVEKKQCQTMKPPCLWLFSSVESEEHSGESDEEIRKRSLDQAIMQSLVCQLAHDRRTHCAMALGAEQNYHDNIDFPQFADDSEQVEKRILRGRHFGFTT